MPIDENPNEQFSLEDVPPELLGLELARWMRGIDSAFSTADRSELVWGHVAVITSVMRLLQRLPGFDCDMVALRDIQARLEKLSVGQKQPIMALVDAVKTSGRAPASFSDHIREVRAVALVQAAMERGWGEVEACTMVASELARVGVKGRRGEGVSTRAVRTWLSEKIKVNDEAFQSARKNFAELLPAAMSRSAMKKFARAFVQAGESLRQ